MPLASKDGKLYYKTVIVDGVEKLQLCSSCCSAEVIGCCYTYSYDNAGNPIFIVSKDTYSGCEEIQKQVDPSFDVVWYKLDDPNAECPENPPQPQPAGVCLYREDELGTCYQWIVPEGGNCDYESAEAADEGAAGDASAYPDGAWWYVYPSNPDDLSEGWCYTLYYREPDWGEPQPAGTRTEENCKGPELSPINPGAEKGGQALTQEEVQSAHDELVGSTWENDLPANKCRPVDSADECTESTGVFCPNVSDCNQIDLAQGCPEWGCCLFCPEQPSSLPCGCADGYVRYGNDNPCGTAGIFQPGKTCEDLGYESNRSNPLP